MIRLAVIAVFGLAIATAVYAKTCKPSKLERVTGVPRPYAYAACPAGKPPLRGTLQ
jgi:hypothetical protein